jgi:hypothetical protein
MNSNIFIHYYKTISNLIKFFIYFVTLSLFITPALKSQDNVEYDHYYKWSEEGIQMEITVKGTVNFKETETFKVKIDPNCNIKGDNFIFVFKLSGEGEVTAEGKATLGDDPEDLVYMTFNVPVKVTINGKSLYVFVQDINGCKEMVNLQLEEKWTEKVKWDIQSDDPEADAYAEGLLPVTLGGHTYKMDKTLEYNPNFRFKEGKLELEEEAFLNAGVPMKGKIRYKINLSGTTSLGSDERYDIKEIQPGRDYSWPKLHWGPPLEQIQWDIIE